ncbi:MAG: hypothetical protein KF825_14220, partial [Ferruginibacter sp.]|nr:hypothetical protein [Ferruginibacter sp.]
MKKLISLLLLTGTLGVVAQNPQMLKDVFPGNNSGTIQQIIKTSNYTFFNEDDDDADVYPSLFRTDGTTAGTIKLDLTYPGFNNSKATMLAKLGDKVVFTGDNFAPNNSVIWVSDGTQAGTIPLEQFNPTATAGGGPVYQLEPMNGYVYYTVVANNNKLQLRRTDGTAAGTSLVYEFNEYAGVAPVGALMRNVNGMLYFLLYDQWGSGYDAIWRSDGTAAGTFLLRDLGTEYFGMGYFMGAGSKVCFMVGKSANNNSVLFVTDGTAAGTVPMYEFNSVFNTNIYPAFTNIGTTLYFAANDGVNGKELWKTDGTAAGTLLAADIIPGSGSSNPVYLTALNNTLYFNAFTPANGSELWKFDGSVASLVKDINPGSNGSGPAGLTVSDNTIIFSSNDGTNGGELWITDGTADNTVMVADINPGAGNSVPNTFTPGNPVYFAATNGVNGFEVYKLDNNPDMLPGPHRFYVNDNSIAGDVFTLAVGNNGNNGSKTYPFATIEYALTQVQADDTIFVDAGTYATTDLNITKEITILGTNYLISPNNPTNKLVANTAINPESIITGSTFTIGSNNITLSGLTFSPGNKTSLLLSNTGYGNFKYNNNRLIINSSNNLVLTGQAVVSPDVPIASGFNFSNNRFEKLNTSGGTTLLLNYLNNVTISNNAFVVTGTTVRTQTTAAIGQSGIVHNLTFSDNVVDKANYNLFTYKLRDAQIIQNKFYSALNGFLLQSLIPESSNITISENLFERTMPIDIFRYLRDDGNAAGSSNTVKIENNIFNADATGNTGYYTNILTVQISNTVTDPSVIIRGNQINQHGNYSGLSVNSFPGMSLFGKLSNLTIEKNELTFSGINYTLPGPGPVPQLVNPAIYISSETSGNNSFPSNAVVNILNNKIVGYKQSVAFYDANSVNPANPYIGYGNLPIGATVNINNNSFTGDSISINNGTTSQTVNATC